MRRSAFKPVVSKTEQARKKGCKPAAKHITPIDEAGKDHPRGVDGREHQWSRHFDPEGKRGRVLETKAANQLEIGNEEEHSSGHRDKRISESHPSQPRGDETTKQLAKTGK